MNYFIQQSIVINTIKIGGISNSSVLQIGSAGIIKPASYLYNTGGFTESAPELKPDQPGLNIADEETVFSPAVPLQAPRK
ncbi:spore germination protein GerPB [Cytobacillus oceanisediminis]|uniref:Spore germination protein GerPB n=2 Tax=Niallia TaxID=2837506 RepID=A0A941GME7_NIACI|nr:MULTISPECIES: spore germination protein GerPB [Bacillaceae]EOR24878.1 spore germination protein [Niallia nealsonii AAU1]MBQ6447912.1 spore germination protein GerPB [Bacillus sp. (in: firmicutes)]MDU1847905.1 spore germination protein GerPB [Niallia nealsonii]MBZ9533167.1 spore germination protein GerPB [Cytobacillus oceanisediminis]MCB5236663.1 spore germination protein GerPB [Niallia circulans]